MNTPGSRKGGRGLSGHAGQAKALAGSAVVQYQDMKARGRRGGLGGGGGGGGGGVKSPSRLT